MQRADKLTDFLYAAFISVANNTLDDFNTGIEIDKVSGSYLNGRGTNNKEFHCILSHPDAAQTCQCGTHGLRNFPYHCQHEGIRKKCVIPEFTFNFTNRLGRACPTI